jgi:ABC-type transport system substrate-binding protein
VTAAIVPDAAADGPLTDLAAAWRTAWEPPGDGEPFLVASGPFQLARIAEGSVELEANPLYSGQRRPSFERVVLWTFGDQLAAVQALQDGLVQAIQVGANDATTDAITRIRADARPLFPSVGAPQLAAWHHREILGVDPGALGAGVLWNLWAWAPAASQGVPEEASAAVGFPQSARAGSH